MHAVNRFLPFWSEISARESSLQPGGRKNQRVQPRAVGALIVSLALANLNKTGAFVQRDRRGVIAGHFQKGPARAAGRGCCKKRPNQLPPQAIAAVMGSDGKGENFGFVGGQPLPAKRYRRWQQIPAETEESRAFSRDLKRRGFNFVGPTIMYAYMQAVGLVNDHARTCWRHGS